MSNRGRILLNVFAAFCLLPVWSSNAHEIRPAYLEIRQLENNSAEVIWKRPVQGKFALHLKPRLSNGWLEKTPIEQHQSETFLTQKWVIPNPSALPLAGCVLSIEGLDASITDVLVRIRWAGGEERELVLRPNRPSVTLLENAAPGATLPAMLGFGIEHILKGMDHLLFVTAMLLLVGSRKRLVKTVTGFTVAHSLTLGAVALGYFAVPVAFVEAVITLSIVFLAAEVIRMQRGGSSVTIRYPWLAAFGFGLFHGLGFANAFAGIRLDSDGLVPALFLFNLGVEAGQLLFIAVVCGITWLLRTKQWSPLFTHHTPAYVVGITGAYWTLLNSVALFA